MTARESVSRVVRALPGSSIRPVDDFTAAVGKGVFAWLESARSEGFDFSTRPGDSTARAGS